MAAIVLISLTLTILVVGYSFINYNGGNLVSPSPEKAIDDFLLVSNSTMMQSGKVVVLFVGAEACPFCAAESWSIVDALKHYGSFIGLSHISSNSSEKIANVPGYGFANASFVSTTLSFWEVETTTSSWDQKLQSLNSTEQALFQKYDPNNSIPFLLIGGMYLLIGSSVSPEPVSELSWSQCFNMTSNTTSFGNQVKNEAKNMTDVIEYLETRNSLTNSSSQYPNTNGILQLSNNTMKSHSRYVYDIEHTVSVTWSD